jgi:hypothetical protein
MVMDLLFLMELENKVSLLGHDTLKVYNNIVQFFFSKKTQP